MGLNPSMDLIQIWIWLIQICHPILFWLINLNPYLKVSVRLSHRPTMYAGVATYAVLFSHRGNCSTGRVEIISIQTEPMQIDGMGWAKNTVGG
jgi:hypothetical protein